LETEGVSVEIVVSLEVTRLCLGRMERMAKVMATGPGRVRIAAIHSLLNELIQAAQNDCSIRYLLSSGTSMLHRKIVERSGQTGQHYIALNLKEYRHIWIAAAGGGLLTAVTAAVKMGVYEFHLPPFPTGFLFGLNYSVSFLIMQFFGFVLATKQPAMTAAHLADIMREKRGEERRDEITDFSARICQSQIAAAMSNVMLVTVGAYALNFVWREIFNDPILNQADAEHVFEVLSPLDSGTIFFAALTGVVLWMASLIGGWFDNFSVYHRLPQAIRDHSLGEIIGVKRLDKLAGVVERNMSAWATNISLGMMLGFIPVVGFFLGIPLDVRHVTLSTGQLALACTSLQHAWFWDGWFLRAVLGIATMFVLNLSVSFFLSFVTAARAYQLTSREIFELLGYIGKRIVKKPQAFLLPPRADGKAGVVKKEGSPLQEH
jgi:site-specific recombinase